MASKRDRVHAGGFIVSEQGSVSRDSGFLAVGEKLDAGTLLEENDDGDLVAWSAGSACAGILFASSDATLGRIQVATVARAAVVALDGLSYPEGKAGSARDALDLLRIVVLSDHAIADTGGGGGGYAASAVHFDGASLLAATATDGVLSAVDSPVGVLSVWVKSADLSNGSSGFLFTDQTTGHIYIRPFFTDPNRLLWNFWDATDSIRFRGKTDAAFSTSEWVNLLLAWDTGHAPGSRIFQAYFSDVVQPVTLLVDSGVAGFDVPYASSQGWQAPADDGAGTGILGDVADYWFAPGQFLDLTVEANRRKFISAAGKPVDLGADGSSPTGTAPAVFFSGDAAAFPTNRGTGGAFALTGPLTNATTSPSD